MNDKQYVKHASRKFIYTIATLLISSLLCYIGKLDADTYENIVLFLGGIYVTGNVIQHGQESKRTA